MHIIFFFNDTATTEIYTLSLHDALPIFDPGLRAGEFIDWYMRAVGLGVRVRVLPDIVLWRRLHDANHGIDRKSTRLNSSHANISYAVFCLKKKKNLIIH